MNENECKQCWEQYNEEELTAGLCPDCFSGMMLENEDD